MRCEVRVLGEQCILDDDDHEEHESESFYWVTSPPIPGRADQANPFARR